MDWAMAEAAFSSFLFPHGTTNWWPTLLTERLGQAAARGLPKTSMAHTYMRVSARRTRTALITNSTTARHINLCYLSLLHVFPKRTHLPWRTQQS